MSLLAAGRPGLFFFAFREDPGGTYPLATMQKHEKKRVAGVASWKLLKIKGQFCREAMARKFKFLLTGDFKCLLTEGMRGIYPPLILYRY